MPPQQTFEEEKKTNSEQPSESISNLRRVNTIDKRVQGSFLITGRSEIQPLVYEEDILKVECRICK